MGRLRTASLPAASLPVLCATLAVVAAACGSSAHGATPTAPTKPTSVSASPTTPTTPPTTVPKRLTHGNDDLFALPGMRAYLATRSGNVTAAVYDHRTGRISVYHPGVAEDTASIVKVDILATLLSQEQAAGRGLTSGQLATAIPMIEQSDNDDAQDLWDSEGGARAITAFNNTVKLVRTVPAPDGEFGLSTTTAADQVRLLQKVAYGNLLLSDASRSLELGLMTHVNPSQAWGVSAGVPAGVTIAIKNGWLPLDSGGWQVNSIGYVDGQGRDYLIAVLTNGNDTESEGIATIEGLSTLVWHELAPGG